MTQPAPDRHTPRIPARRGTLRRANPAAVLAELYAEVLRAALPAPAPAELAPPAATPAVTAHPESPV